MDIPISIGDFSIDEQTASKAGFKMNFFRTEKFGSKFGDTDDLGMAWGRASLRQYVSGVAIKKSDANGEFVELTINSIGIRFIDSFDFQNCFDFVCNPFNNQPLGVWKHDVVNPQLPLMTRFDYLNPPNGWTPLNDKYFFDFKKSVNVGIGGDYNSFTDFRFWNTNNPITKKVIFRLP